MLRIISRHGVVEKDVIYRAKVVPVEGRQSAAGQFNLNIIVGYGILVVVRPQKVDQTLHATRAGRELQVENPGNTNLEVRNFEQCNPGSKLCKQVAGRRVYAGKTLKFELPFDAPAEFTYRVAGEYFSKVAP